MFAWCAVSIELILKLGAEGEMHDCPCIWFGIESHALKVFTFLDKLMLNARGEVQSTVYLMANRACSDGKLKARLFIQSLETEVNTPFVCQ